MSRNKFTDSEYIRAAMAAFGCQRKRELAEVLGISPADLSNRIRRGTVSHLIEMEALRRHMDPDDLVAGDTDVMRLLDQARRVLESRTPYRALLESNILAYHGVIGGRMPE